MKFFTTKIGIAALLVLHHLQSVNGLQEGAGDIASATAQKVSEGLNAAANVGQRARNVAGNVVQAIKNPETTPSSAATSMFNFAANNPKATAAAATVASTWLWIYLKISGIRTRYKSMLDFIAQTPNINRVLATEGIPATHQLQRSDPERFAILDDLLTLSINTYLSVHNDATIPYVLYNKRLIEDINTLRRITKFLGMISTPHDWLPTTRVVAGQGREFDWRTRWFNTTRSDVESMMRRLNLIKSIVMSSDEYKKQSEIAQNKQKSDVPKQKVNRR